MERLEKEISQKEQQCRKAQGELEAVRLHTAESERALEKDNKRLREERDHLRHSVEKNHDLAPVVVELRAKIEKLQAAEAASRKHLESINETADTRAREAEDKLKKTVTDRDALAAMLREAREELGSKKRKVALDPYRKP